MLREQLTPKGNRIQLSFAPQLRVEVQGKEPANYVAQFWDARTERNVYTTTLTPGHWGEPGPKYYVDWRVQVAEDSAPVLDYRLDLKDKDVLILFDTRALGDTVAWFPCVEQFQNKHGCRVTVRTFWNELFQTTYPNLRFQAPGSAIGPEFFCSYVVGCYEGDYNRNKQQWRAVPLQQIASDCLGLEYKCQRPRVAIRDVPVGRIGRPYVAISEFAAGYHAKQWLRPGGWQRVVDALRDLEYDVVSVSTESSALSNVVKRNGRPIAETVKTIWGAEFFIGCSSGPSILAWALWVPTVIISGFTEPWGEVEGVQRVINEEVCHGCMNDFKLPLDRGNPNYCPRGQHHACTLGITPEAVLAACVAVRPIPAIPDLKSEVEVQTSASVELPSDQKRILLVVPHGSTGGGPQYWLQQVQKLLAQGEAVAVIEMRHLSDEYTVQRKQLQALLGSFYYCANGNEAKLFEVINHLKPTVVHLHEAPELMLSQGTAELLFAKGHPYHIVQTLHNADFGPEQTRHWPDMYWFVSQHHVKLFRTQMEERGISFVIREYELPKRERPDRTKALQSLGLDPSKGHVLNVGLFTPGKNQGEIWGVARQLPGMVFHCVGNQAPNFKEYWGPLMAEKPDNVVVWGERDDVDRFYSAMDLFLFTSIKECFPIVVKEALSWGMRVLMRNLPAYQGAYDEERLVTYIQAHSLVREHDLAVQVHGLGWRKADYGLRATV